MRLRRVRRREQRCSRRVEICLMLGGGSEKYAIVGLYLLLTRLQREAAEFEKLLDSIDLNADGADGADEDDKVCVLRVCFARSLNHTAQGIPRFKAEPEAAGSRRH